MDILVEITRKIPLGTVMRTPSARSDFVFQHVDPEKILLLIGKNKKPFKIPAPLFDSVLDFFGGKDWIRIGAIHGKPNKGTFDEYVQGYTSGTSGASYIAAILEKAGIAEINRKRPARIRLRKDLNL